ncbi:MAG TPA: ParB/RepB/Spo0J family partition protein, partial [Actinomycetales bacterium]|nr:ParB/RepB/Spo0J family partition protein [Actinomycetales bacterium]
MEEGARPSDIFFTARSTPPEEPARAEPAPAPEAPETGSQAAGAAKRAPARKTSTGTRTRTSVPPLKAVEKPARSQKAQAGSAAPAEPDAEGGAADGLQPIPGVRVAELPVADISPNPRQPREVFDEEYLEELAASITEVGLLQPIVVRPAADGAAKPWELIMGERRLRASQMAELGTIPAVIRETEDSQMLRDALLENLHRANLNPLEEAAAYQQLLDDFGITQEELARRIARSRPQISNTLRLLKLPSLVQRRVAAGVLSAGHARALLGLEDGAAMERLAQRIV